MRPEKLQQLAGREDIDALYGVMTESRIALFWLIIDYIRMGKIDDEGKITRTVALWKAHGLSDRAQTIQDEWNRKVNAIQDEWNLRKRSEDNG